MLQEAWKLLELQFRNSLKVLNDDVHYKNYALEKWRHSQQVAGAGNYIIPKINWLKKKSDDYIDMVKSAVLLHDVCRFTEMVYKYKFNKKYDHGVGASEFLQHTAMFNDIRIWLPIKHHGHIIERLYEDEVFQVITDTNLKKEVELICFIIRDADKIANLNMLVNEPAVQAIFLNSEIEDKERDANLSEVVKASAFRETTVARSERATAADRITGYVSWFMDINYQAAIDYCDKLMIKPKLFALFDEICADNEFKPQYKEFVNTYLRKHKFID